MITTMVDLAVDLSALEHNYLQLRRLCAPRVKMLAVVKADAYGHGLLPVARKLAEVLDTIEQRPAAAFRIASTRVLRWQPPIGGPARPRRGCRINRPTLGTRGRRLRSAGAVRADSRGRRRGPPHRDPVKAPLGGESRR